MLIITVPMHNRAWLLTPFLAALEALAYPQADTALCFLDDHSTDGTLPQLTAWAVAHRHAYARVQVLRYTAPPIPCTSSRDADNRLLLYDRLADIRNRLLDTARAWGADYQLSLDSDILVTPGLVAGLQAHGVPYCGSLVLNDNSHETLAHFHRPGPTYAVATGEERFANMALLQPDGINFTHLLRWQPDTLTRVDLSGAVYLADRRVLDSGARFGLHLFGEDAWYCLQLRARGLPLYCDTTLRAVHIMEPEHLDGGLAAWRNLCAGRQPA